MAAILRLRILSAPHPIPMALRLLSRIIPEPGEQTEEFPKPLMEESMLGMVCVSEDGEGWALFAGLRDEEIAAMTQSALFCAASKGPALEICRRVEDEGLPDGHGGAVTISVGICHVDSTLNLSLYDCIQMADKALCRAKKDGKNRDCLRDPGQGCPAADPCC